MSIRNNIIGLFKSFGYAFSGIITCVKSERNLRIHLCAAFYVLIFMQFYDLTVTQTTVVIILIALVISLEMLNSAIEKTVDICSPEKNELAKFAKDVSAAAVLIVAIASVVVAVMYFWDTNVFVSIFNFFLHHYLALAGLIISIVLWILFIFKFDTKNIAVEK